LRDWKGAAYEAVEKKEMAKRQLYMARFCKCSASLTREMKRMGDLSRFWKTKLRALLKARSNKTCNYVSKLEQLRRYCALGAKRAPKNKTVLRFNPELDLFKLWTTKRDPTGHLTKYTKSQDVPIHNHLDY
jgi:hypothetical protein